MDLIGIVSVLGNNPDDHRRIVVQTMGAISQRWQLSNEMLNRFGPRIKMSSIFM